MFHLVVRDIQHISFCFGYTFLEVNKQSAYYFTILPTDGNVTITPALLLLIGYLKHIQCRRVLCGFEALG